MRAILRLFGLDSAESGPVNDEHLTDSVRNIVQKLESMPVEESRFIAAFAYLLGRVAHADLEISPDETAQMEEIVREVGNLEAEQAIIVVQMAKSQNRLFGGTENFLVSKEFNKIASREQKMSLLRCLFAVSSSDDTISVVEDNEVRQISRELLLDHADFIQVRSDFRDYLSVLRQNRPDPSEGGLQK